MSKAGDSLLNNEKLIRSSLTPPFFGQGNFEQIEADSGRFPQDGFHLREVQT